MEPDSRTRRHCERCDGSDDLYLLTFKDSPSATGNALVCCAQCRAAYAPDVAVPLTLVTPRLLLGLQRLRKLDANLSGLLQTVEFG